MFGTVGSVRERVMSRSQTPRNDGPQATSAFNGITAHLLDRIASLIAVLKGEQIQLSENNTKRNNPWILRNV